MPATLSRPQAPHCDICSFEQLPPLTRAAVYHQHHSARQYRVLQRVEFETENKLYLCPSCNETHPARVDYGLNICLSDSQLHSFHTPRDPSVKCPPDTSHIDWVTIPGGKISDLDLGWYADYHREPRPMRILLVAGLNDLVKGGTRESVMTAIRNLKEKVTQQNRYHPGSSNQFAVSPLVCPPKLVWYPDSGPLPHGHAGNRRQELDDLNNDILSFNAQNGLVHVPHFNTLGVRRTKLWFEDGSWRNILQHRMNQWRATEEPHNKLHLVDGLRVKMGQMVVKYFEGEMNREDGAIAQY